MSKYFLSLIALLKRSRVCFGRIENHHVEPLHIPLHAPGRRKADHGLTQPAKQISLHEADFRLIEVRVLLGQGDHLLIEIYADDLVGLPQHLCIDGESPRVAAQIEHALAGTEASQQGPVVALIDEEAGLVLTPGCDAESHPVLRNDARRRRRHLMTVERLLLLHVLLGEPVELAVRELLGQNVLQHLTQAEHAGREEFEHNRRTEAIDDEPAEPVPLRMDDPIRIGDGVEVEPLPAQFDGPLDPSGEEVRIDRFVLVGGEKTQRNARVPLQLKKPRPAQCPSRSMILTMLPPGMPFGRFFEYLLKDPRMRRSTNDFEFDLRDVESAS